MFFLILKLEELEDSRLKNEITQLLGNNTSSFCLGLDFPWVEGLDFPWVEGVQAWGASAHILLTH